MPEAFITSAGEILRSGKTIEERLKEWCSVVSGFAGSGIVSIMLFDQDSEDFFIKASTCKIRYNTPDIYFASQGTLENLALAERRPVVLEERVPLQKGYKQGVVMVVPLISYEEPVGVLVVNAVTESGFPQERQVAVSEAAKFLADTIGSSLREESTIQRMAKIAAINEVGVNIISTLDLPKLLKLVATSACTVMEAEACIIRLVDTSTGKCGIRECYGTRTGEGEDRKILFLLDKKAVTRILKGEPSLLVRNMSEDQGWSEFAGEARTLMCLPLKGDESVLGTNTILGTITIVDRPPEKTLGQSFFSLSDMNVFSKFAQYAEKAIANAITYERNDQLRNIDELTGLPTLKYFRERLMNEISRARRFKRRLVLLMCEVHVRVPMDSSLRESNVDDQIFKQVAKLIRGTLREYDVVARISHTKFGMILPETDDGQMSAVNRIGAAITSEAEQIRKKEKDTFLDVRFGYAVFPDDGDDQEKLIFKSNILKL